VVFVKTNAVEKREMFVAEAEGLEELAAARAIRVPRAIAHGVSGSAAFLILEWIEMTSRGDQAETGRQLAALHRWVSEDGRYGWHCDNVIGETPQVNDWCGSWPEFFVTRRLEPQLRMAREKGGEFVDEELFLKVAGSLLRSRPEPSLLHGDLWIGNAAFVEAEEITRPVLFDPATYYGDRETDLAFTEFFGGFSPEFYGAYIEKFPLEDGYERRRDLYNLYHVLNHWNLFGGGYLAQAKRMMQLILSL
jgi:fructosamine-3-kinase